MSEPLNQWYDSENNVELRGAIPAPKPVDDLGNFVHLHVHSNLSFRDSINVIEETAKMAAIRGQKALALTDHGHAFGAARHAIACKEAGIQPIFGMEAYEAHVPNLEKEEDTAYPAHLTLLVMNEQGWLNMCALHKKSYLLPHAQIGKTGRVYPRVDKALLEEHNEGLICMSACLGGHVQRPFLNNEDDRTIKTTLAWYQEVFEDRFYMELMANTTEQCAIIHRQRQIARSVGVKTVATNDVHYVDQRQGQQYGEHHIYTAARYGIDPLDQREQGTDEDGRDKTGWYGSDGFYLKTEQQMLETGFKRVELDRTIEIASRCVGGFDPTKDIDVRIPDAPLHNVLDDFGMMMFESWRCGHGTRKLMRDV